MSSHEKIFGAQDEWGSGKAAGSGILTDRDEYFYDQRLTLTLHPKPLLRMRSESFLTFGPKTVAGL